MFLASLVYPLLLTFFEKFEVYPPNFDLFRKVPLLVVGGLATPLKSMKERQDKK
jgi:hypothetical protein